MSDIDADTAPDWQLRGAELYRKGDLAGATQALARAAELAPDDPAYRLNLAELTRAQGQAAAAARWLGEAAILVGRRPEARSLNLLAAAWLDHGRPDEALETAATAIAAHDAPETRTVFVEALRRATRLQARHRPLVARALAEAWTSIERLQRPAGALLAATWPVDGEAMAADPLLAAMLTSGPIRDAVLEQRLTALRRAYLETGSKARPPLLLARLATQGFHNEYAWNEEPAETAAVEALWARVAEAPDAESLTTLACYRPLADLPNASALLEGSWPPLMQALLQAQVAAPLAERAAAPAIPAVTPIRAGVSEAVRGQYEANAYPRWAKVTPRTPQPLQQLFRSRFPRAALAPIPGGDAPHVLIAGCGTGQHACDAAQAYAGAEVLAVDLSRASLAYGARMAREHGVDNLTFAQADLLELGALGRRFDVIECVGVLHHMADPGEGARVLAELLNPGGVMALGLYSALARRELGPAKTLAGTFPPTAAGIRDLRAAIQGAPAADPVRHAMTFGDFFAASTCRDLLMHVQEHELAVADLQRMIAESGLRLLGFSLPPEVLTAYRFAYPDDPAAVNFAHWTEFEARHPATFRGMYHIWVQKPV